MERQLGKSLVVEHQTWLFEHQNNLILKQMSNHLDFTTLHKPHFLNIYSISVMVFIMLYNSFIIFIAYPHVRNYYS